MSFPRYPEYKDSGVEWLGEVPGHWELVHLKRIAFLQYGDALPTESRDANGDVPVFGSNGPVGEHAIANTASPVVLVGRKGSCGAVNWSDDPVFAIDTVYYLDSRTSVPGLRWTYWILLAANLGAVSQDTGVPGLSREIAHGLRVALPRPIEQSAIAAFLDRETAKIDALVAEQEKLIALLKEKRQAVISHAVTKGLDPSVPMKDSGIEWLGEVPAHWEVVPVKRLVTVATSGPRGWSDLAGDEGAAFFQSQHIGYAMNVALDDPKRLIPPTDADAERARLQPDDVVICITGGRTGAVAHVPDDVEEAYINQHVCLLRPQKSVSGRLLAYSLFSSVLQEQLGCASYGLKQGLGLDQVRSVITACPPTKGEQMAIVAYLDAQTANFDALTAEAQRAIELLKEHRSALISAAVTGKIDVRGLVSPQEAA